MMHKDWKQITIPMMDAIIKANMEAGLLLDIQGKPSRVVLEHVTVPWYVINAGPGEPIGEIGCRYWQNIINMPGLYTKGIIPTYCMDCYKVVVSPNTVRELFAMLEPMEELNWKSKLGVEYRDTCGRNYGCYFYNRGLEAGQECKAVVRKLVDEVLSPEHDVFLKRACTEYELEHGDSLLWETFEGQKELEEYIVSRCEVVNAMGTIVQSEFQREMVKQRWIRFAYARGDKTYLDFMPDGQPLYPDYRKY